MQKMAILLIAFLVVSVGFLSGCNEQSPSNKQNGIEILNYTVTTHWSTGSYFDGTYKEYNKSGFYHDIPEDAYSLNIYYMIEGTIKNNAGTLISYLTINAILYDINNNELCSQLTHIPNVPNSYTKNFSIKIDKEFPVPCEYFDNAENVKFSISINDYP